MSLDLFLNELRALKVTLAVDGDQLSVRAPKGVITKELGLAITTRKQEILQYLKQAKGLSANAGKIQKVDRSLPPVLSFGQKRLWFLYELEGASPTYNMPLCFGIHGDFKQHYFEQALSQIIQRHEILRYNFISSSDGPTIIIKDAEPFTCEWIDLTLDHTNTLQNITQTTEQFSFDLARDDLIQATVVKTAQQQFHVSILLHHIVADGWSIGVLFKELQEIYTALCQQQDAKLQALPIQYFDYAHWQSNELAGTNLQTFIDYWKTRLAGCPELLTLTTDHPRPNYLSYAGKTHICELDSRLTEGLKALSQSTSCTLYMTLLAGFAVFLSAHSGQDDLMIGSPVANRNNAALEGLIGLFINTLPIRIDLSGDPTVEEFLNRVRSVCVNDFNHQEIPFEKIVEVLNPTRSLNHAPLYQVAFDLQTSTQKINSFANLQIEPVVQENNSAKFDLSLSLEDDGQRLIAYWNFSEDLFVGERIAQFATRYVSILEQMIANPKCSIREISILNAEEKRKLFTQQRATAYELRPETNVLTLIADRANEAPDRIAITFDHDSISYGELEARSTRLAHLLRLSGVATEDLVALYVDRSAQMVVAMLAIMKAGAAYIPIDPNFPADRITWILEDATPKLILTEATLVKKLNQTTVPIHFLDALIAQSSNESSVRERSTPPISPLNIAYVIFTSGSTGRPKGVQVTHRALYNFLHSMQSEPGFTQVDTLLAVTTISFDIAGLEMFLPLITGGRVVIASRDTSVDGRALQKAIAQHGITTMQATPVTWRVMLETGWKPAPTFTAFCGGEALAVDLSVSLTRAGVNLWNLYGPTETTIWSAVRRVLGSAQTVTSVEPIGHPILNTQLYVLNRHFSPQASQLPGELYIGGEGLARGYLKRPALTADSYRPDPFGQIPGARLYKTGDLVAWSEDQTLQFLGRIDHQVKIRGYRIELGEIESRLRQHTNTKEAVVIARTGTSDSSARILAYLTVKDRAAHSDKELRVFLKEVLPEYMVPAHILILEAFPLTPNEKIDRKVLPEPESLAHPSSSRTAPQRQSEKLIGDIWSQILKLETINIDDNFFDLGGHSLLLSRVNEELQRRLEREIPLIHLFEYPTIRSLSNWIDQNDIAKETSPRLKTTHQIFEHEAIAIIGVAARVPGADDCNTFWENLRSGQESIRFFSETELQDAGVEPELIASPNYIRGTGVLSNITDFDAEFFSFTPAEAKFIDPQQRVFLETAWQALENAGYADPKHSTIGVFAGVGHNDYLIRNVVPYVARHQDTSVFQLILANDKDFLATRVSYAFNLTGPSITVQTACSTSLVAIHQACQSLLMGDCDIALAGGVAIKVPHHGGYLHEEGNISSPDGHCRAFDIQANGTVWGSGAGVVILKPLSQALKDRDKIHAVIKGSAVNNDGSAKVGFTAPSVGGQANVIQQALAHAQVSADTIDYIETHGTGTALGDLIEITALKQAYASVDPKTRPAALGSVKTNIGHLNTAAGVAGLLKTVLALQHKEIPKTLHFTEANPKLGLTDSHFYVPSSLTEWPKHEHPRRAAISSFGIGGTNAHVILEEAPVAAPSSYSRPWHIVTLSAKSQQALKATEAQLKEFIDRSEPPNLADLAFTLAVGRKAFQYRSTFICQSLEQLREQLASQDTEKLKLSSLKHSESPRVAFLFPGQGTQYVGMGISLYNTEPLFRETVDYCAVKLQPLLNFDLREFFTQEKSTDPTLLRLIHETWITQPLLFVTEYAMAKLWMHWNIKPFAMLGHSLGEYVAACLSGVFDLDTALTLIAHRGRLVWSLPRGSMLAVAQPASEIDLSNFAEISIASINEDGGVVVAGPTQSIKQLADKLNTQHITCTTLQTSHAFHSSMLDPILEEFRQLVQQHQLYAPLIPFVSNVTGTWISAQEAQSVDYWVKHLRAPVQFAAGAATLLTEHHLVCLEVGPKSILSRLIKRRQSTQQLRAIITSLDTDRLPEDKCVFDALAKIWNLGLPVSWDHFYEQDQLSRVSLPTYPFERKRHWIDAPKPGSTNLSDDITARRSLDEWFYLPHWRPTVYPETLNIEHFSKDKRLWLVFANESTLCQNLLQTLKQNNQEVVQVTSGARFQKVSESAFIVSPRSREDYDSLIKQLCNKNIYKVLHCWSLDVHEDDAAQADQELLNFEIHQEQGFYSLMNISHALANFIPADQSIDITVIADRLHDVYGTGYGSPGKATLIGPSLVIPQEVMQITIHCIDLALSNTNTSRIVTKVLSEIENGSSDPMVAYRGDQRLVPSYQRVQLNNPAGLPTALVDHGVYVITGGLGKVGLTFARYLGEKARARLCLVSRTIFPERSQWQDICAKGLPLRETIQTILNIEKSGAEILILSGDVANPSSLADCFSTCMTHFGKVNGVFHAAGAPSLVTPFVELTPEVINEHYSTKVFGTFGLKAIFDQQPVDFCCLISSSSAVLGGLGYAAYSAANIFLDHFVSLENSRQDATRWLSIDWDAWKFSDESTSFSKTQEFSMSPDESIEALERILKNLPSGRVIVATGDLEYRFKNWVIREDWRAQSTLEEIGELHVRPELDSTFIAATTPTEHKLGQIWQSLLGYSSIGVNDNFFELGGDSMLAIRLMSAIKEKFQQQLPLTTLLDKPTIKEIALALELPTVGDKSSILVSIQAKGAQPPLFCAPGTGGSVIYLRALANELAVGDRPFIGLQAIVSPETQKPFTSIQDIARLNIEAMQTVQPSGPYYLCGHSFGSWVALEMAFQLQQTGHELGHLFIIDTGVPSEKDLSRIKNWDDAEWLSIIADTVGQTYNKPLGLIAEELKKLTWDEQVEQLFNRMKDNGLIDEQDGLRDVRSLVEMYKSQAQILYTPQNMKVKHLSLIRAQDIHESFLEGMPDDMKNDPLLGWAQFSIETPTLKYVSGNHLTMMQHPHVKLLASAINQTLTRSTEDLL